MNLILPVKQVGMLSVKPPDETFVKLKTVWGENEFNETCPKNGAILDLQMTAAVRISYTIFFNNLLKMLLFIKDFR